mmetsp:Transcript_122821/g.199713  ORF Transcript_122821/g.199713 Transcript_122821/m.199713 type:complete len:130 (+) Transcript_122821:130-519(+)
MIQLLFTNAVCQIYPHAVGKALLSSVARGSTLIQRKLGITWAQTQLQAAAQKWQHAARSATDVPMDSGGRPTPATPDASQMLIPVSTSVARMILTLAVATMSYLVGILLVVAPMGIEIRPRQARRTDPM